MSARRVRWRKTWRIIASRYPPVDLFERVSSKPEVWGALIALEQLTNPRLRDEVGLIRLVPLERRVSGPNASWVMAPFTHINPKGSRFSDGSYGVYYAARTLATAIAETAYHFARFARDANDPPRRENMRVLLGSVDHWFDDVNGLPARAREAILDKDSYAASRTYGRAQREAGSDGLVYPSVRDDGGQCIAAFWPDVVGVPVQERHLKYDWDGERVSRCFDYKEGSWVALG
jgi:hypothetical protein